jgi:hypothetical protein
VQKDVTRLAQGAFLPTHMPSTTTPGSPLPSTSSSAAFFSSKRAQALQYRTQTQGCKIQNSSDLLNFNSVSALLDNTPHPLTTSMSGYTSTLQRCLTMLKKSPFTTRTSLKISRCHSKHWYFGSPKIQRMLK